MQGKANPPGVSSNPRASLCLRGGAAQSQGSPGSLSSALCTPPPHSPAPSQGQAEASEEQAEAEALHPLLSVVLGLSPGSVTGLSASLTQWLLQGQGTELGGCKEQMLITGSLFLYLGMTCFGLSQFPSQLGPLFSCSCPNPSLGMWLEGITLPNTEGWWQISCLLSLI